MSAENLTAAGKAEFDKTGVMPTENLIAAAGRGPGGPMNELDYEAKNYQTPLTKEESLICEALVREMAQATRWSAVLDAFNALGHVRLMAGNMHREAADGGGKDGVVRPSLIGATVA